MSLVQKTVLIIGITLAALMIILYSVSSSIAGRTISALEKQEVLEKVGVVLAEISEESERSDLVEYLAKHTLLQVDIRRWNDPELPADFLKIQPQLSDPTPILVRPVSREVIAGYALIPDIYGHPALMLRVDIPRLIYEEGRKSLAFILLFFLIVGIGFLILSAALLGQFVIFPLTRLESCIRKIRECTSLSARVPASGRDEIARLGRAINEMLDEIEKSCNQVKKSEELLRHSQKMEAVGRLAGGVAHDFNNLLTAIIGYSDLVLKSLPSDNPQRKDVEEIRKAGERATILTHQLLAFGRKQMFEPRVLDLNQVVSDMHKMLSRLMGEDVEIETILAKNLWPVRADLTQIEQAILNLAINARDAMPDGGKLIFETTNTRLDENYALRRPEVSPGDFVMLAVSDTGVGMNPEVHTHLFEPFFTTKVKEKRTGLGLSTVYGIVKQSGGSIFAYSEPGLGTTLKIYLPRVEAEARGEGVGKPLAQAARGAKETILLVEDEEMVRRLTYEVLQREGYTVLEASNGPEALQIFERDKGAIQVLLTDVVMPRMSGYELAESIVKSHPEIKVVYMSGYTDQDIISQEVVKKGAGFIQKPFTPEILTRKLREALERR